MPDRWRPDDPTDMHMQAHVELRQRVGKLERQVRRLWAFHYAAIGVVVVLVVLTLLYLNT